MERTVEFPVQAKDRRPLGGISPPSPMKVEKQSRSQRRNTLWLLRCAHEAFQRMGTDTLPSSRI